MTVWAISDLHLSHAREDPRERFAGRWRGHAEKIAREWRTVVRDGDLVLVPGDISMARNHREVQPDLAWLDRLPGIKVLSPGNHDGWWNGAAKVRPMLRRSLLAVDGDAITVGGMIVCGARGTVAGDDDPALGREVARLTRALEDAVTLRGTTDSPILVLWHPPPFDPFGIPGAAVAPIERANATVCVYGHLHAQSQWPLAVRGPRNGVIYHCVAADSLGFRPLKILAMTASESAP